MHVLSMLSDGFFLSLSLCLDIGLVNVAVISLTLSHGFRPGFWLGLGSCFGDLLYAALALAGMAALLQFDAVRWIVWIGGAAILLFLTWKMAREALYPASAPPVEGEADAAAPHLGAWRGFVRGALLAISSPSAILWFAAVGGALIAKAGATTAPTAAIFLGGFFLGGLAWTLFLCGLASHGRKRAGTRLLRACHVLSALLFAYFSYSVIVNGYRDLIVHAVPVH
ncbi:MULTISPECIES: LysE family translocator [Paraburkholderia]|uniref:L-lysine exporter family protein LysE/ArgO n=1 Tax=Paraburkholderia megapolitana TaxID=420953 RepID=A0A1I3IWH1_9BURK|nr:MULTISPECIES: LysE family transporter [Paraburkholderia]MCX4160963.1 LysE family transporter [Paraburkholderia megapolitana]MDN7156459.1 LysE family translocator [Paraburkholderia sp. CHISQ3]MDQ6493504.1 LysE family translocator [Paraburkholderia megapolitana]QDQ85024.1 LysE family translocator [Paraburkholderia megapolitana]SFI52225.1 L-lysine exporter family protein LysE/ArgO [Paraburkholderia megapolitana]